MTTVIDQAIRVTETRRLPGGLFSARLQGGALSTATPGQFVLAQPRLRGVEILPHMLSVLPVSSDEVEVVWRLKGSAALTADAERDALEVLGPLGCGFDLTGLTTVTLLAERCGAAPITAAARALKALGADVISIYVDEKESGWEHLLAAEVATPRHASRIEAVQALPAGRPILGYGSTPLFQHLLKSIPASVRLQFGFTDARVGCGIGTCIACAVETPHGYKRACTEGPVFDASLWR